MTYIFSVLFSFILSNPFAFFICGVLIPEISLMQSLIEAQWNVHGKPAMEILIQKVVLEHLVNVAQP